MFIDNVRQFITHLFSTADSPSGNFCQRRQNFKIFWTKIIFSLLFLEDGTVNGRFFELVLNFRIQSKFVIFFVAKEFVHVSYLIYLFPNRPFLLQVFETEISVSPIFIDPSSFLDETLCSVPDLEEIPNPDSTNVPSFLGQNYENRDCIRVLRSNRKLRSSFHPCSV